MHSPSCRVTTRKVLFGFRFPIWRVTTQQCSWTPLPPPPTSSKSSSGVRSSSKRRSKNRKTTSTTSKFGCFTARKRHHLLAGSIMYLTIYDLNGGKTRLRLIKVYRKWERHLRHTWNTFENAVWFEKVNAEILQNRVKHNAPSVMKNNFKESCIREASYQRTHEN